MNQTRTTKYQKKGTTSRRDTRQLVVPLATSPAVCRPDLGGPRTSRYMRGLVLLLAGVIPAQLLLLVITRRQYGHTDATCSRGPGLAQGSYVLRPWCVAACLALCVTAKTKFLTPHVLHQLQKSLTASSLVRQLRVARQSKHETNFIRACRGISIQPTPLESSIFGQSKQVECHGPWVE